MRAAAGAGFPEPLFVHQASVEAGDRFFAARAPAARAIADTDGRLFTAFGLRRGSLRQLFGLRVWWLALRALLRGHLVGRPSRDPRRLAGAFLVRGRRVLWQHRARHAGDLPELQQVTRAAREAATRPAAHPAGQPVGRT